MGPTNFSGPVSYESPFTLYQSRIPLAASNRIFNVCWLKQLFLSHNKKLVDLQFRAGPSAQWWIQAPSNSLYHHPSI